MASTKSARLELRLTPEDRQLFEAAAEAAGQSLSEFIALSGREHAERVLADRTVFSLDSDAWETFMRELDRPPRENERLSSLLSAKRPD
jgi:uncharacterized protein (DUF1778 family)